MMDGSTIGFLLATPLALIATPPSLTISPGRHNRVNTTRTASVVGSGSRRRQRKLHAIEDALSRGETALLRQLAISEDGLLSDDLRRQTWPVLVDLGYFKCAVSTPFPDHRDQDQDLAALSSSATSTATSNNNDDDENGSYCTCCSDCSSTLPFNVASHFNEKECSSDYLERLQMHKEFQQVDMDVKRTLTRFPPNIDEIERFGLQRQLTPIITAVLLTDKRFQYYQGFHDVCLTVFLVLRHARKTFEFCLRLANTYFHPFLTLSLENSCCKPLRFVYPLIYANDKELFEFLDHCEVGIHFAVSWTLTWFAHVLDDYPEVTRLYDLFLASHPLLPIYLTASILLYKGQELMEQCPTGDMPTAHSMMSRFWQRTKQPLPLEALVFDAQDLFARWSPSHLTDLLAECEKFAEKRRSARRRHLHFAVVRRRQYPITIARGQTALIWGLATAAAAYYFYNSYLHQIWALH